MTWIDSFSIPPSLLPILAAILALLIERFVFISSSVNPLSFYRFVCQRMANKVLKTHYKANQAALSGCLGLLVLVLPIVTIGYLLYEFASYQWLLDVLLLWVLLQFSQDIRVFEQSASALEKNKNLLAKSYLQSVMLRNTNQLSSIGINKASIEGIFLRYTYQQVTVVFCYFIGGPVLALFYRLCYEAKHAWNPKIAAFSSFGKCASILTSCFQYLPALFTSLTFMLTSSHIYCCRAIVSTNYWKSYLLSLPLCLLFSLTQSTRLKTGGPVMYSHTKIRRSRVVGTFGANPSLLNEPTVNSIKILKSLIARHLMVSMAFLCGIVFMFATATAQAATVPPAQNEHHKQRIITLSPHLSEIVYALNRQDALVGVSDYSDYPAAASEHPVVASYQGANVAQIIRLKPTHILVWRGGNKDADIQKLQSLGFNVYQSAVESPQDLLSDILGIGRFLQAETTANALHQALQEELDNIQQQFASNSATALYYLSQHPLTGLGNDTWLNGLLDLCGIENIYKESLSAYPALHLSDILRQQPSLIIAADGSNLAQVNGFWSKHQDVYTAKYVVANPDALHRFTPRAIEELAKICQRAYQ